MASALPVNIYQFKITLKGSEPNIWRRIQVPENYNFGELHMAIQDAMGWGNYHLHQFEIINPRTGQKSILGIPNRDVLNTIPEETVNIAKYFLFIEDKASYEYDFVDKWQHEVVLEKILPAIPGIKYQQCIEGELACPPESCGGVGGYEELKKILANPSHKDYVQSMEWMIRIGRSNFNPINFYPKWVEFNPVQHWKMTHNAPNKSNVVRAPDLMVYHLQIVLRGIAFVWRRIQVPENYNFFELHLAIHDAMEFKKMHKHLFEIFNSTTHKKTKIGLINAEKPNIIPQEMVKISQYINFDQTATYIYDVNNIWKLDINLEFIIPAVNGLKYPRCTEGMWACPIEYCDPPWQSRELQRIVKNQSPRGRYDPAFEKWLRQVRMDTTSRIFDPKLVIFQHSEKYSKVENYAPDNTSKIICQFKITLKGSSPSIWRRIQIPRVYNFHALHVAIQDAMGWKKNHLHQFKMINPMTGQECIIGIPLEEATNTIPEEMAKIFKYFVSPGDEATYEYDFRWSYQIVLELFFQANPFMEYPRCIDGKLTCPPEDCDELSNKASANASNIYQFKIIIRDKPIFMQSIQVPGRFNFRDLYFALKPITMKQIACYNSYDFKVMKPMTAIPYEDDGTIPVKNDLEITEYFLSPGDKAIYKFHCWQLEVVLEKILPAIPGVNYPQRIKC